MLLSSQIGFSLHIFQVSKEFDDIQSEKSYLTDNDTTHKKHPIGYFLLIVEKILLELKYTKHGSKAIFLNGSSPTDEPTPVQ